MKSPIQTIEQLVKSEDYARMIAFYFFFSRFEYALKRAGYYVNAPSGRRSPKREINAEADWPRYGRDKSAFAAKIDPGVVKLLKDSPPQKQIVSNGCLGWSAALPNADGDFDFLLLLVRRIRNNLFHGEKCPQGAEEDVTRNVALMDAGLSIMQSCLDEDDDLRRRFLENLE